VSALRASVLLPKDFLFLSKIFSFLLVSWFSPLKSVFVGFIWPEPSQFCSLAGSRPRFLRAVEGTDLSHFQPILFASRFLGLDHGVDQDLTGWDIGGAQGSAPVSRT
jgi:hypothetical protein